MLGRPPKAQKYHSLYQALQPPSRPLSFDTSAHVHQLEAHTQVINSTKHVTSFNAPHYGKGGHHTVPSAGGSVAVLVVVVV